MKRVICNDRYELGHRAAAYAAQCLNEAIANKGNARLLLSAGESLFETYVALMKQDVPWECVEVFFLDAWDHIKFFHLDRKLGWTGELIPDIPEYSGGSYRKYIKENVKEACFMEGIEESRIKMAESLKDDPIDVALLGMGQMAHPVFYGSTHEEEVICRDVILADADRAALETAWFENPCELPKQLCSVTVNGLLSGKHLILCVPAETVSEEALEKTKKQLKEHASLTLFTEKKAEEGCL